uniref:Tc1-like transposase DDE domain-containing protein n=1 Tax=Photinus pyralis TaxID=7054 RepID=A0A1Y1LBA1_PHOPY
MVSIVILKCLRISIKSKRPGKLTNGVTLLHDNARPDVTQAIQELLSRMKWEVLQQPPYSPDLSPCNYYVFGPLRQSLKGRRRFKSDTEVDFAVGEWFRKEPQEFYQHRIYRLVKQWDSSPYPSDKMFYII